MSLPDPVKVAAEKVKAVVKEFKTMYPPPYLNLSRGGLAYAALLRCTEDLEELVNDYEAAQAKKS